MNELIPCPNCGWRKYTFAYPFHSLKKAVVIDKIQKTSNYNVEYCSKILGINNLEKFLKLKSTPVLVCTHCENYAVICPNCREFICLGKKPVNICSILNCPDCMNEYTCSGVPTDYDKMRIQLVMQDLENMVGMKSIKNQISDLVHYINTQNKRKELGLPTTILTLHMVFTGNPGTGKTTVARILGEIYKTMGLLKTGHLVEVDRKDLVAEYIGHTAIKTSKKISEAMGGILFIDEAYSLVKGDESDFGREAIDILLKSMEDNRDKFVVIVAGYPREMEYFLECNPGLKSRFANIIKFDDYIPEELEEMFKNQLFNYEYEVSQDAMQKVKQKIVEAYTNRGRNFSNGRFIRNLFDQIVKKQSVRISRQHVSEKNQVVKIILDDILDIDQV